MKTLIVTVPADPDFDYRGYLERRLNYLRDELGIRVEVIFGATSAVVVDLP